jgi:glutamate formiminotransferase/formiminotetrahydrofolate cyclodeaminase
VPQRALNAVVDFYLRLENFSEDQILEHRLQAAIETREENLADSTGNFSEKVAANTPTPGGGSVAAYAGALAASLGRMASNLTVGKKKYADVEPRVKEIASELERTGARLRSLIDEDAASFDAVMEALRLPKETDEEKAARKGRIEAAGRRAAGVPMETARCALEVLKYLGELAKIANQNAFSDIATGGQMALAATKGACYNVGVNLSMLPEEEAAETRSEIRKLMEEASSIANEIESSMIGRM